jgi:hypothetical protein
MRNRNNIIESLRRGTILYDYDKYVALLHSVHGPFDNTML